MAEYGFSRSEGARVGDVIGSVFPVVAAAMSVGEAAEVLRDSGRSVAPVVKGRPPYSATEVIGSIDGDALAKLIVLDPTLREQPVAAVMDPPLPRIGVGESLLRADDVLRSAPAAVVHDGGHPVAMITRADLVSFAPRSR